MKKQLLYIVRNRFLQHLIFWLVAFVILLRIFTDQELWNKTDIIYTLLFLSSLIGSVYINLEYLAPKFLNRRNWIKYFISVSVLFILTVLLNEFIFEFLCDWIFPGYYFISYYSFFEIGQFVFVFLLLTTLIKLSRSWFELQETQSKMLKLEGLQRRTELEALRAQVNPHFLFNNLHSIYSLAISGDKRTPDVTLKLAGVLRYMLYDSNVEFVDLNREIECVEQYFDLQKTRLHETTEILFSVQGSTKGLKIAPLLLMPLVENSFKHGILEDAAMTFVKGSAIIEGRALEFRLENSFRKSEKNAEHSGIGLENLQRRLALIYPERHYFEIKPHASKFEIVLKVNLA